MRRFKIHVLFVYVLGAQISMVSAQSIASSLAQYKKTSDVSVSGLSVTSFSGVAFHPNSTQDLRVYQPVK